MPRGFDPLVLRVARPPLVLGIAVAALGVATATGAIALLDGMAPAVSLSVVYIVAVLAVSTYWGAVLGVLTSVASAAAFNYVFLPPVGRFTVADSRNLVALLCMLVVAVFASTLAEAARARALEADARRREADLGAELARTLLGAPRPADALAPAAHRLAELLGLRAAAIELGPDAAAGDGRTLAVPLHDGGAAIGALRVPADLDAAQLARLRRRVVPVLESVLGAALARERLQAEVVETASLRRSDELKTSLLRSVSHDLRTPVTAVLAGVQALGAASLTDTERGEVEGDIEAAATRLSRLIDKLLDLARLQGGSASPQPMWCSVEEVLREAVDHVGEAGAAFRCSVAPDLPLVRADPAQLERAFANLMENAARHGRGRPVSVRARVVGHRIVIRVVDQGPGIPPHEHERIFTPFYRGAEAPAAGGSGLGLAIAKGFVEANGGRIHVESYPGQGATFVIELPVEPVDDAAGLTPPPGAVVA
jgi:two-component system sensor histidine kinase KdpD